MDIYEESLEAHKKWQGKLDILPKMKLENIHDLSLAYTPGVAEPCRKIQEDKDKAYLYTMKSNTVAVVTDGTAVLGLGDIGPLAGLPVMEGKAVLFKEFGGINAVPICLATKDVEEIVKTVKLISPAFGAINLEDISAPRCFEIEERLKHELDIPVFHDDQHGTAIVVLAAMINAFQLTKKDKERAKIVINGAGSAGIAITKLLLLDGFQNILLCDTKGIIYRGAGWLNWAKKEIAEMINPGNVKGDLAEAMKGADVFIGVSAPGVVNEAMVKSMNPDAIVFALSNPVPEIMPELALKAGARIVGTGRSDFPNQINNVLAFPGIFQGVLNCGAKQITEGMKIASAYAIAGMVEKSELKDDYIIPKALNRSVPKKVAEAVVKVAENLK